MSAAATKEAENMNKRKQKNLRIKLLEQVKPTNVFPKLYHPMCCDVVIQSYFRFLKIHLALGSSIQCNTV